MLHLLDFAVTYSPSVSTTRYDLRSFRAGAFSARDEIDTVWAWLIPYKGMATAERVVAVVDL